MILDIIKNKNSPEITVTIINNLFPLLISFMPKTKRLVAKTIKVIARLMKTIVNIMLTCESPKSPSVRANINIPISAIHKITDNPNPIKNFFIIHTL